jgi:hypothetical protein
MSDFVASLNDRTDDDEPAKKKPKTLSGYFELFVPNNHVQVSSKIEHERKEAERDQSRRDQGRITACPNRL